MRTRRAPWPPPQPIAPSGKVAASTVAGCLILGGSGTVVLAWNELTCEVVVDPGAAGVDPASVCEVLTGIGGVSLILGAVALAGGLLIVRDVRRREVRAGGSDAWRWGLAVVFTVGLLILSTRIPSQTCPGDAHLSGPFRLCIDVDRGLRFDSTSWIWAKTLLALTAPVIGFGLLARRGLTKLAVPLTIAAWVGGIGWLLLDTLGRDLRA
jgi:uncharacterized YccA/Bax inhibitor family protein